MPASYFIAFLLLTIVMMELHEMAHILLWRLICGCWGVRDFNVWWLCKGCDGQHSFSRFATLAGPLFSFGLMWVGMFGLFSSNSNKKAVGFSLIFANIPFGRISEVARGQGDEMLVARHLLKEQFSPTAVTLICLLFVLALGLPPIVNAFRVVKNRRSWIYLVGFLTLPVLFILIYILSAMNSLLSTGFMSTIGVMGTPLLITIHTVLAACLLFVFRKQLFLLNRN